RMRSPYPVAGLHVVGCEMAADAELGTGYAEQHPVLDHNWRGRAGLTLGWVAVLCRPDELAGFSVERGKRGVGLMQEDLAIGIGNAPVDRVAAHHGDNARILLRLIFPEDFAIIVQVEGKNGIRKWGMNVHNVADHERPALMATKNAR